MVCRAVLVALVLLSAPAQAPAPGTSPAVNTPANREHVLALIRARFRSHRPPPPFVTYTLVRSQLAVNGFPDLANSYTKHMWVRTSDGAALTRLVFANGTRGPLTFDRPAFNEARDPGPPTADLFASTPELEPSVIPTTKSARSRS
jgi:hypothetical protein